MATEASQGKQALLYEENEGLNQDEFRCVGVIKGEHNLMFDATIF
jgi:hypothetical protein